MNKHSKICSCKFVLIEFSKLQKRTSVCNQYFNSDMFFEQVKKASQAERAAEALKYAKMFDWIETKSASLELCKFLFFHASAVVIFESFKWIIKNTSSPLKPNLSSSEIPLKGSLRGHSEGVVVET